MSFIVLIMVLEDLVIPQKVRQCLWLSFPRRRESGFFERLQKTVTRGPGLHP
jgi:hypothetical protein